MTNRHHRTDSEEPADHLTEGELIAPYLHVLRTGEYNEVDDASWALTRLGGAEIVAALLPILSNKAESPNYRSEAAAVLGRLGDSEAVRLLCSILLDRGEDLEVRTKCLWSLPTDPEITEILAAVASNALEDLKLRIFAVWQLEESQTLEAMQALLSIVPDSPPDLRRRVAKALGVVGDWRVVETLTTLFSDEDTHVRSEAVGAFQWLAWHGYKATSVVDELIGILTDPLERVIVRRNAASSLGAIGDGRASEPLIALLSYKGRQLSYDVVDALGELKSKDAVEPLLALLVDSLEDEGLSIKIIRGLGKIGDMRAADFLVGLYMRPPESNTPEQRLGALKELEPIEGLLESMVNSDLRENIIDALKDLGDPRAYDLAISLLKSDDLWVRDWAAGRLGEIGDHRAVEPLIDLMLNDPAHEVRWPAAQSLILLADERSAEALRLALKDDDHMVRGAAAEALGALRQTSSFDVLAEMLCNKNEDDYARSGAAKGLSYLSDKRVVPLLLSVIDEDDDFLLYGVAEALGDVADRTVLPTLEKLHERKKWDWIDERITDSIALIESKYSL